MVLMGTGVIRLSIEGRRMEWQLRREQPATGDQRPGGKKRLTTEVAEEPQRERRIARRDFTTEDTESTEGRRTQDPGTHSVPGTLGDQEARGGRVKEYKSIRMEELKKHQRITQRHRGR
jgi:hypothetical protein